MAVTCLTHSAKLVSAASMNDTATEKAETKGVESFFSQRDLLSIKNRNPIFYSCAVGQEGGEEGNNKWGVNEWDTSCLLFKNTYSWLWILQGQVYKVGWLLFNSNRAKPFFFLQNTKEKEVVSSLQPFSTPAQLRWGGFIQPIHPLPGRGLEGGMDRQLPLKLLWPPFQLSSFWFFRDTPGIAFSECAVKWA